MQQTRNDRIIKEMMDYDKGMAKQIQHFLKVYEFAHIIGTGEGLDDRTEEILETAAILHDIGIKPALEKYGSSAGKYQEELGPDEAEKILTRMGYDNDLIERVKFLIGHHHTYNNIEGPDYQILVEADFLVNLYEDNESPESIRNVYNRIFKTGTGRYLCSIMYDM